MKLYIFAFLEILFFYSCRGQLQEEKVSFDFPVYNNEPMFADEYLYPKKQKNGIKISNNELEWYLIDWDENGKFNDIGTDYFGVKSPWRKNPITKKLSDTSYFRHDNELFMIMKSSNYLEAFFSTKKVATNISYISNYIPIELSNGTILDKSILKGHSITVIYFWASWCSPCIQNLIEITLSKNALSNHKINFIPIFYECSKESVLEIFKKKKLNFEPLELSEKSAILYQIYSLSQTFVFDEEGKLISEEFNVADIR